MTPAEQWSRYPDLIQQLEPPRRPVPPPVVMRRPVSGKPWLPAGIVSTLMLLAFLWGYIASAT